jgi:hypothetical protein
MVTAITSVLLLLVLPMLLAGRLAESRGRSVRGRAWLAFAFGPFATLAVWLLPHNIPVPARRSQ